MKPRIMAMISNAVHREPPRRHRAPAQSLGPNSRAPYEPPIALSAVPITSLHVVEAAAPSAAVACAPVRLGAAKPRARPFLRKKRRFHVNGSDLSQREPARDPPVPVVDPVESRRLLAAARADERATLRVGAAVGRLRAVIRGRKRREARRA